MELNINSPKYYKEVYGIDDEYTDYVKKYMFILRINHIVR